MSTYNTESDLPNLPEDVIIMILSYLPVKDTRYDQCMEHLLYMCGKSLCCWAEKGCDFPTNWIREINDKGMCVLRERFGWYKKLNSREKRKNRKMRRRQLGLREKIKEIQQNETLSEKEKAFAVQALYAR